MEIVNKGKSGIIRVKKFSAEEKREGILKISLEKVAEQREEEKGRETPLS